MPLTNRDMSQAPTSILNLNNLYNGNLCAILFDALTKQNIYSICEEFWSGILLKGMEQSFTQMSVFVTAVIDDLNSLNFNTKNLTQIISDDSVFTSFEKFVQIYLLYLYITNALIFSELVDSNLNNIFDIYKFITIGYCIFGVFLFFVLLFLIQNSKSIFYRFMNFILILPTIYIIEGFIMRYLN